MKWIIVLAVLLLMVGCATVQTVTELDPVGKATLYMKIYNAQADDYKMQAAKTTLSEEEKKILRGKHAVLTEVYPLLELYSGYATTGQVLPEHLEPAILYRLNMIGGKL